MILIIPEQFPTGKPDETRMIPNAPSRWWSPRHPATTRRVACTLLTVGVTILASLVVVLPPGTVPAATWLVGIALVVNGAACWVADPNGTPGHLASAGAAVTGIAGLGLMWWVMWEQMAAGAALLGIPVVYASSQFRRPAAIVTSVLVVVTAAVVMLTVPDRAPLVGYDLGVVVTGVLVIAVVVVHHVEQHEAVLQQVDTIARTDAVTGLVTRRVLDDAVTASLRSGTTVDGVALLVVDVDRFKLVNDDHGHPAGDAALQHVAQVLTASVRDTDCVVSRMGGDELAVLLVDCPLDTAVRRGQEIVDAVRAARLVLQNGEHLALTVSLGVAHAPSHAADPRSLFSAADQALYTAKRAGRDRCSAVDRRCPP